MYCASTIHPHLYWCQAASCTLLHGDHLIFPSPPSSHQLCFASTCMRIHPLRRALQQHRPRRLFSARRSFAIQTDRCRPPVLLPPLSPLRHLPRACTSCKAEDKDEDEGWSRGVAGGGEGWRGYCRVCGGVFRCETEKNGCWLLGLAVDAGDQDGTV